MVEYKCEYTAITEQEDEYMIELIVSDMDGTLLNDKMEVSASNVSAINEANRLGIKFMVATGRGYTEAVPALKENSSKTWGSTRRLLVIFWRM